MTNDNVDGNKLMNKLTIKIVVIKNENENINKQLFMIVIRIPKNRNKI